MTLCWQNNVCVSQSGQNNVCVSQSGLKAQQFHSPGHRPGFGMRAMCSPCKVGCSKFALKSCAFFAYGIDAFDHQIWREVFISPFLNMAVSTCLQSFFKFEVNSSVFICQMKT